MKFCYFLVMLLDVDCWLALVEPKNMSLDNFMIDSKVVVVAAA